MGVFLDTGFFFALKNENDKNFDAAQMWMRRFLKNEFGSIYTSSFVFNELVTLALVRLKRTDLTLSLGNYILKSNRITLVDFTSFDFNPTWEKFQKYLQKRLSFTDCSILTHCERLNCDLVATFDDHFKGIISTTLSSSNV